MNRIIALLIFVLLAFQSQIFANEQLTDYAVKAGINFSTLNGQQSSLQYNEYSIIEPSSKLGLVAGGFINMFFSEKFSVQAELLYSMKGVNFDAEEYVQTWSLIYAELPILFKSNFILSDKYETSVYAGPAFSYLLSATWSDEINKVYQHEDVEMNGLNSLDMSLVLGADIRFEMFEKIFGADIRYTYGVMSIQKTISTLNGTISLSFYYLLNQ